MTPPPSTHLRPTRAQLEKRVREVAAEHGWLHHHSRYERRLLSGRDDGFPSEVLSRKHRLVFVLLPSSDEPTRKQAEWTTELESTSMVEVLVVRPDELDLLTWELARPEGGR